MKVKMDFMHCGLLVLLFSVTIAQKSRISGSKPRRCPQGQFLDIDRCVPCSTCGENEIIEVSCSEENDQICGPFVASAYGPKLTESREHGDNSGSSVHSGFDDGDNRNYISGVDDFHTTIERDDRDYWKTLAFTLIGLLSVLIIIATIVVFLACRKLQQVTMMKQPDDPDNDDADSGYVVIRAIRNIHEPSPSSLDDGDHEAHPPLLGPDNDNGDTNSPWAYPSYLPQGGKLCFLPRVYKPRRWLLNYDTDDVFESDDSAGSVRLPQKLTTISEKSEKSDRTSDGSKKGEV